MPVLILRIVAILIPVVGAIIYARKLTKKTKGKKLIVLGKKATGKSSLVQLLAEGTMPEGHVNHAGVRKFIPKIKAEDLGLHLSEEEPIEDWPGENEHREKGWQMTLPEKDLIIYLFRADHLLANGNDGKRIRADIMSDIPHILTKKKTVRFFALSEPILIAWKILLMVNTKITGLLRNIRTFVIF